MKRFPVNSWPAFLRLTAAFLCLALILPSAADAYQLTHSFSTPTPRVACPLLTEQALSAVAGFVGTPSVPVRTDVNAMSPRTWKKGMTAAFFVSFAFLTASGVIWYEGLRNGSAPMVEAYFFVPYIGLVYMLFIRVGMSGLLRAGRFLREGAPQVEIPQFLKRVFIRFGMSFLLRMVHRLLQERPELGTPQFPKQLFFFDKMELMQEPVEETFIRVRGRTLQLHPDLAPLVDLRTTLWIRIPAHIFLWMIGAAAHEPFHSLGVDGERRTWLFMNYLPPVAGYVAGIFISGWLGSPFTEWRVTSGLVGTVTGMGIVSLIISSLANWLRLRATIIRILLRLSMRGENTKGFSARMDRWFERILHWVALDVTPERIMFLLLADKELIHEVLPERGARRNSELKTEISYFPDLTKQRLRRLAASWEFIKEIDGLRIIGETPEMDADRVVRDIPKEFFVLRLRYSSKERWIVEFWRSSQLGHVLNSPKLVGTMKLHYSPTGGALDIFELSLDPAEREKGLYRGVIREMFKHLKRPTLVRFFLKEKVPEMENGEWKLESILPDEQITGKEEPAWKLEMARHVRAMLDYGFAREDLHPFVIGKDEARGAYIECYSSAQKPRAQDLTDISVFSQLKDAPIFLRQWWSIDLPLELEEMKVPKELRDSVERVSGFEQNIRLAEKVFYERHVKHFHTLPSAELIQNIGLYLRLGILTREMLSQFLNQLIAAEDKNPTNVAYAEDKGWMVKALDQHLSRELRDPKKKFFAAEGNNYDFWEKELIEKAQFSPDILKRLDEAWDNAIAVGQTRDESFQLSVDVNKAITEAVCKILDIVSGHALTLTTFVYVIGYVLRRNQKRSVHYALLHILSLELTTLEKQSFSMAVAQMQISLYRINDITHQHLSAVIPRSKQLSKLFASFAQNSYRIVASAT